MYSYDSYESYDFSEVPAVPVFNTFLLALKTPESTYSQCPGG